jgi:hypothetical protein
MKKLLLISIGLLMAGCVVVPVSDYGYYYPNYVPYPYSFAGPEVNFFFPGFHGGHSFRGGGHGFHGGGRWGGNQH